MTLSTLEEISKILIVDDDEAALQALVGALEIRLYRVSFTTASSAAEALRLFSDGSYDVVISDINMPEVDGLELLARLHAIRPEIPIVLISGHAHYSEAVEALKTKAYAFLPKPLDREYLTVWIKRALELSHLRRKRGSDLSNHAYLGQVVQLFQPHASAIDDPVGLQFVTSLIDAAPCLLVLTDPDGKILLFNRDAERFTGRSREEVLGKPVSTFIPPQWQDIVGKRFAHPSASEVRAPHRNPWLGRDGEERMIEWRCTPFTSSQYSRPCILGAGIPVE